VPEAAVMVPGDELRGLDLRRSGAAAVTGRCGTGADEGDGEHRDSCRDPTLEYEFHGSSFRVVALYVSKRVPASVDR
jgi:hypothetical protein